jgi:hypothetical protein
MTLSRHASDAPYNPRVAFGLLAVATAYRAKCGRCSRIDGVELVSASQRLVADDGDAASAAASFAESVIHDQAAAGVALHDFVSRWRGGDVAAYAAEFTWQDRKDCGHD